MLPSPPRALEVDAMTENALKVRWKHPKSNPSLVSRYLVNVTTLRSFDSSLLESDDVTTKSPVDLPSTIHIEVVAPKTDLILNNLTPFTMYEISVYAANKHGTSLPSYTVRSLTLVPGKIKPTIVGKEPKLPNVMECCLNKGVNHKTCVHNLCDPEEVQNAEITDLMICAPWATETFSCLTNGMDHTPCCKARGLPPLCQQLCSGNVSSIDFSYFK